MELRVVEFSADYLPHVQQFECGDDLWCQLLERWIKSAPPFRGALESIRDHGNTVWLYFLDAIDEEFLVGFSSLGTTKWRIPPPDGPKREAGFLPMLAVASRFQGKPKNSQERPYVDQIMEHVIQQAHARGYRELCLFVYEANARAVRLYKRHGFQVIGERDERGCLKMLKLLD